MTKTRAVILDWAGTTVDFGCFAPIDAFAAAFGDFGIEPDMDELRAPMGLAKRAHIEKMLEGERLSSLWREKYGRAYTPEDIDRIYARFEPALFSVLEKHAEVLPGVLDTVRELRAMGIAIGSTTGYTRQMMDVIAPLAMKNGYAPDFLVCPEDVGGRGRPYPYMLWRNLEALGISSVAEVVKVGDTAADMEEGKNAGCFCVGVLKGSSMMGLSDKQYDSLSGAELSALQRDARNAYEAAGADLVISDISSLAALLRQIS